MVLEIFNSIQNGFITHIRLNGTVNFKGLYSFLKMIFEFFNYIFFFFYNLVSVNKGYFLIFENLVSKIWFDSLPKFPIIGYSLHITIIVENLKFLQRFSRNISLSFISKEISSTIIFPIFIKKASLGHNCFSELFIHEGRLVTSNMLFLYFFSTSQDMYLNFSNSPG